MTEEQSQARASVDHLFRHQSGRMVATLVRIFGIRHLDLVEEMVQEAFVTAMRRWPYHGLPQNPTAWLVQVAKNRALDELRRQARWEDKKTSLELACLPLSHEGWRADVGFAREVADNQLRLIFACCHPSLSRDAQVALTLKTVGGFSVSELARAFLVKEPTMAQRIVRAKARLKEGEDLVIPPPNSLEERLEAVMEVLYLMFNEGYGSHEGQDLIREDLCGEAIRLAELLCDHKVTSRPTSHALAALFLIQGSRFSSRVDAAGEMVLLRHQDRSRWDAKLIERGMRHMKYAARGTELTAYHLEAEIAAAHATAMDYESTDWDRIVECYDELLLLKPSPVVALNRLVARAEAVGAPTVAAEMRTLLADPTLASYYPAWVAAAEIFARCDRGPEAAEALERAIGLARNATVLRHLERRRTELASPAGVA